MICQEGVDESLCYGWIDGIEKYNSELEVKTPKKSNSA